MVGASVYMLPAPQLISEEKYSAQNVDSILSLCLDALAKACTKTVFAAIQTLFFSLSSDMGLAGCANPRETYECFGMMDKVENSAREGKVSSVLASRKFSASSEYENAVIVGILSAQCSCCMAIRSCATLIVEKLAAQSYNCSAAVGKLIIEEEKQPMQCSKDQPCLSSQLTRTATNLYNLEEYSPYSYSVRDDDRFLQGPDTNVIMSSKEINAWIAAAKNKDDEDEDDDDDDEDDDDEEDNDDDGEEGSAEEEEGEEELQRGEGAEGGEDDDDEGDEGEEGEDGEGEEEVEADDEEDEDGVEGEEEEDAGGDEGDGYDKDEGEEDEDEEDEDEDEEDKDKDETSEPPKKKRK